ncbi:BTAD domain-containing putative transcriptional regulator [Actinomadura geliboluensis]|uniref:BTAD domain-containing putative transcriptional regulator n=1 Tax=Actinomadura geliboluensis TaxID=882440 RepID=UPI0026384CC0|nr:BTAD domain-containing putative transcriptional regulator [Actinomadura geliboluensis]
MRQDTDQSVFLATIFSIAWGAWCLFIVTVCAELMNYLAGRSRPALPRPVRPLQQLVRDLVATATLTFSAASSLTTSATAATQTHAAADVHVAAVPETGAHEQTSSGQDTPPREQTEPEWAPLLADEPAAQPEPDHHAWRIHTVKRGETLWSLARRAYGSGALYPKIFKNSRGIDQPHEVPALTDPDVLHPGQRVRLPRPVTPDGPSSPSRAASPRSSAHEPSSGTRTPTPPGATSDRSSASRVPSPVVAPPVDHAVSPAPSTPNDRDVADPPLAISLPSGSRIGLGLAAALSVAVAATRLHRRRRRPLRNDLDTSEDIPEPPIAAPVLKARKAHLDTYADREAPVPTDPELVREDLQTPEPDHLVVGTRHGQAVTIPLAGLSLGLSGHGAPAAARAITTELLAKAHRYRVEVLIPQPDAQALFPGDEITNLSTALEGLIIKPSLREAITHLEAELLRRGRVLEMTEQPDVAALRADDPAELLPTVLLVASIPADNAAVHALATLGCRFGVGVMVLGAWTFGTSVELSSDGTVTDAHGPDAAWFSEARLFHLTTGDATGMLRTIRTATGTEADAARLRTSEDPAPEPEPHAPSITVPPPRPPEGAPRPPVSLEVLGDVRLHTADGPIRTGLRQRARDLLAYLALHPDGVTRDRASADLWPDDNPESIVPAFNTAVTNIRSVLRAATGLSGPMYVIHRAGRYSIDPGTVDVDLWQLTADLADARQASDDSARIRALTLVADRCGGEFASGLTQEWAEVHREYLRRTIGDALANLARLLQEDDPEQALVVLEQAITRDPYSEPLYRHVMRLQARLDRPDAVNRTYRLLAVRLDELDTEPDEETRKLLNSSTRASNRN